MWAALAMSWMGCGGTDDSGDPVVATAYDQRLHWSDLRQVIPLETGPEDSAAMAAAFVNGWLQEQVVLHKAEENISAADKDFDQKLRDYRNSLLLFAYEQELVNQKLDTAISEEQMQAYLDANKVDFGLKEDIARLRWFTATVSDVGMARTLGRAFERGTSEDRRSLELWAAQNGVSIQDRSSTWTSLSDLHRELPAAFREDVLLFDRDERRIVKDEDALLFLEIIEHHSKGDVSPLTVVERDIKAILLNQRKLQLLERMRQDLYREALDRKDIRIH